MESRSGHEREDPWDTETGSRLKKRRDCRTITPFLSLVKEANLLLLLCLSGLCRLCGLCCSRLSCRSSRTNLSGASSFHAGKKSWDLLLDHLRHGVRGLRSNAQPILDAIFLQVDGLRLGEGIDRSEQLEKTSVSSHRLVCRYDSVEGNCLSAVS